MASSSSGGYLSRYDVFLSFRGEDTRHRFTDHLYDKLLRAGVYTFRDDDAIPRGEFLTPAIKSGIRESRASIIVLSKCYATSRWCLDELCLILKQKRERNHYVLPIFYHVDPSHVRKQTGTFQINVAPERNWTEDIVKRWKAALVKVGSMTGEVASNSRPETKLLEDIIDIIRKRLDLKQVYRQANLVGMENRDKDINSWLEQSDSDILAIWGMDGGGKTTLSRHIAYSNWKKFDSVSIIEDIANRPPEGLRQLQEKLIKDIFEGKEQTNPSSWQGTYTIEHVLERRKALIILDNIVTKKQLEALVGIGTGTNTQSKIIITTEKSGSSKWFKSPSWRCQEYEMKLLDYGDSYKLLKLHAFEPDDPTEDYEELANKVLQYCQGHPLALEVLGSCLKDDKSKDVWDSRFKSFERELHGDIKKVLRIRYDSLPLESDRSLFLHIACFFIGKNKDFVGKILEPDYSAISGIITLTKSCLLFDSPNNKLKMHPLFKEMGRTIVFDESPQQPGKRSRVWRSEDSHDVLINKKGSSKVEGLALDMEILSNEHVQLSDLKTDSFKKMNYLKLLKLNQLERVTGSYNKFSKDLRWLCWRDFRLDKIPLKLDMGKLVAIDMSYSKLEFFEPPKVLSSLKFLNLKESYNLEKIENIDRLPNLQKLNLQNCITLVRVRDTLGEFTSITKLNLTGCKNLCNKEKLLEGDNRNQPHFLLPNSLKRLLLMGCNLEDTHYFPLNFNDQPLLEYMCLASNPVKLLPNYTHLYNLRVLDLSCCRALKELLCLPSKLAELYIFHCNSLETITFESHKYNLQEFRYEGCLNLSVVEDFFKFVMVAMLTEADLGHMSWLRPYQDREVSLVGDDDLIKGRSSCLQMLYEFNIMSISLPDIQNQNLTSEYEYTSEHEYLSFSVPKSPMNRRLKGLSLKVKYTIQGDTWAWFAKIKLKGVELTYNPKVFGKPASGEIGVWISYWPIGDSLLEKDIVEVDIVVIIGLEIQGYGASLVYTDDEDETESFEDGDVTMVDANKNFEDDNNTFEDSKEHADILGADISRFKLSTGTYYLCRRDYSELMEVGRLSPNWFYSLVGDTIDYTEIGGWRKTGRPDQPYRSYAELKTVRCITYGPELEEIYKIAESTKSSLLDETMEDVDINETVKSTSSLLTENTEYSGSDLRRLSIQGEKMEVDKDSVKLTLDNELIKVSHIQSMEAHKNSQPYITNNKKEGAGSSLSSAAMEILIFSFNGLSEDDWYYDDLFGETDIEKNIFPCLRRIGEDRLAKVNKIFLQRFQDMLHNTGFKLEVEKAVMVDAKKVLFTGHSSGGAIASFATLWMLDEYTRKRGIKSPIGCITFGSPLIGDETFSHAVQREKWAGHFTHFVMEHDIVPRIMLAPKRSIQEHLPKILNFFQQNIKPITRKPSKIAKLFSKKGPDRTIGKDQLVKPDEAVSFFETILTNASTVASHDASVLMETTSSLIKKLSDDFVKVSPYRPFGHYVFCTCDKDQDPTKTRQLLIVENPNAVLQLLFYFLQIPKEDQDLVEFAANSLSESFSYEEELNKNGLQLQNMVHLKDLNKQLLSYDGTTDDVVHTSNKALFELDVSAKMCLMAVEEVEDRKKKNEERIKTSMRKYQTQTAKTQQRIIEDILDEIRDYKEKKANQNMDYYEAFKLQNNEDDYRANVNRVELRNIYDEIIEMVKTKDLPNEFEAWDEWVDLARLFRRLVEPLDIANYYRHTMAGLSYMSVRPKRYKFAQRWYEHANAMEFETISESNFMAEVEELKKDIEEPRNKTLEEIKERFESLKIQVQKWKSDDKIPKDDVYWGDSALSMLEEKLS